MFDEALSPQQLIVIDALSEGMSTTDAAAQAGVHRNTISHWRRTSLFFRESLVDAQYDRALLVREKTEQLVDRAFATLDAILADPKVSPSVRLKAALFIIEKATTPPAPRMQVPLDIEEIRVTKAPPVKPQPQTVQEVHKNAQSAQTIRRETESCPLRNRAVG